MRKIYLLKILVYVCVYSLDSLDSLDCISFIYLCSSLPYRFRCLHFQNKCLSTRLVARFYFSFCTLTLTRMYVRTQWICMYRYVETALFGYYCAAAVAFEILIFWKYRELKKAAQENARQVDKLRNFKISPLAKTWLSKLNTFQNSRKIQVFLNVLDVHKFSLSDVSMKIVEMISNLRM